MIITTLSNTKNSVFDPSALPQLLGSSEYEVLRPFYVTLLHQVSEFEMFLQEGSCANTQQELNFRAHKLKSSAHMAGANALSQQLNQLENKNPITQKSLQNAPSFDRLLEVCRSTSQALRLLLDEI